MHSHATGRPAAAIFDLDGTLTDNMGWHTTAFGEFLARHSLPPITMDLRRRIDGKRNDEIFPLIFDRELSVADVRAFEEEKEGIYRDLSRGQLRPLPGARELIDQLTADGIQIAVATSAPEKNVRHTLDEIGLADRFLVIARGDQVPRGKPFPDVFLHAAALVGAAPDACLAFEDAPLGVIAAKAAGMRCIAVTTSFGAEELRTAGPGADATCATFSEVLARGLVYATQP